MLREHCIQISDHWLLLSLPPNLITNDKLLVQILCKFYWQLSHAPILWILHLPSQLISLLSVLHTSSMFFITLTTSPLNLAIPGSSNANQYSNPLLFQQPQTISLLTEKCLFMNSDIKHYTSHHHPHKPWSLFKCDYAGGLDWYWTHYRALSSEDVAFGEGCQNLMHW